MPECIAGEYDVVEGRLLGDFGQSGGEQRIVRVGSVGRERLLLRALENRLPLLSRRGDQLPDYSRIGKRIEMNIGDQQRAAHGRTSLCVRRQSDPCEQQASEDGYPDAWSPVHSSPVQRVLVISK